MLGNKPRSHSRKHKTEVTKLMLKAIGEKLSLPLPASEPSSEHKTGVTELMLVYSYDGLLNRLRIKNALKDI